MQWKLKNVICPDYVSSGYFRLWNMVHVVHTLSEDYFKCWLDRHCNHCIYMSDICMYGEKVREVSYGTTGS